MYQERTATKSGNNLKLLVNHYFNRIKDQRNAASAEEEQAFKEKEALLAKVKEFKLTGDQKEDLATIKEQINNWKNIGRVPRNKKTY